MKEEAWQILLSSQWTLHEQEERSKELSDSKPLPLHSLRLLWKRKGHQFKKFYFHVLVQVMMVMHQQKAFIPVNPNMGSIKPTLTT